MVMVRAGLTSWKTLWLGQMVPFRGNLSTIIIAIISYILIVNVFAINTINIIVIISKFLLFSSQRASSQRGRGNLLVKREKRERMAGAGESAWLPLNAPPTSCCTQTTTLPQYQPEYAFFPSQTNYQIPNLLLYSDHLTSTLPTPFLLKILH